MGKLLKRANELPLSQPWVIYRFPYEYQVRSGKMLSSLGLVSISFVLVSVHMRVYHMTLFVVLVIPRVSSERDSMQEPCRLPS
jgi:hypothetical protein